MAELEDFKDAPPTEISDFASEPIRRSLLPEATTKNRAAYTALLTDNPDQMGEVYKNIVFENEQGVDYTAQATLREVKKKAAPGDIRAITSILTDTSLSDEQKRTAVAAYRKGEQHQPMNAFAVKAAAAPVKNSNAESEARLLTALDQWKPAKELAELKQGIRNRALAAQAQEGTGAKGFVNFVADLFDQMIPFSTNKQALTQYRDLTALAGVEVGKGKSFLLPGSTVKAGVDAIKSMPIDKQIEVLRAISQKVSEQKGIFITDENHVERLRQLDAYGGEYTTFDSWLDNLVTILDVVGIGSTLKMGVRAVRKAAVTGAKVEDVVIPATGAIEQKTAVRSVVDPVSPVSPGRTAAQVNNDVAKGLDDTVLASQGDEVAQAIYGTDKAGAAVANASPQIGVIDGSVEVRLLNPTTLDSIVREAVQEQGATYFTAAEKETARKAVEEDINVFTQANGLFVHDNLASVVEEGGKVKVNATFGTGTGGFVNAEEAMKQTMFSLREYGITDKNLTILKRQDGEYVPVSLDEVRGVQGDYLVQSKFDYQYGFGEVGPLEKQKVWWNFFDIMPFGTSKYTGSLANNLVDHGSMLSKLYTGPGVRVFDRAVKVDKALLELHAAFTDKYIKLPKDRQAKLFEHIKEANANELHLSDADLRAQGFNSDEISALKDWRNAWDNHYFLENADLIKTLDNQGYKLFENAQDRFIVKPREHRNTVSPDIQGVYDPDIQQINPLSKADLDDLYLNNGYYAELKSPIKVGGTEVTHILVRNNPSNYTRTMTQSDQVLRYKKGYYQVGYDGNVFVDEIVRDGSGREIYRRAIAIADSNVEADQLIQREMTSRGLTGDATQHFISRADKRDVTLDSQAYWDLQGAAGRIAQKHRGQPLVAASNPTGNPFKEKYIINPVAASVRAARSLSGRVAGRDAIAAMKERATQQYGEYFKKSEVDKTSPLWPTDSGTLTSTGRLFDRKLADARTTVNYINYLEHGYDNAFDVGFKATMNYMAQLAHAIDLGGVEKLALNASKIEPAQQAKRLTYLSFIANNPLRQLLIQGHQSVRAAAAANPMYMLSGKWLKDTAQYMTYASGALKNAPPDVADMIDFVKGSGMLEAIDLHNLTRGSINAVAESLNPALRTASQAASLPRQIGFDAGESASIIAHSLAVFDNFKRQGKNMKDKAVREEAYSVIRGLTYDMNFAGDMPYNQTSASLALQFFQVPHKAILQPFNRRIPWEMKARMAAADVVLFGVPGAMVVEKYFGEVLPEQTDLREAVVFGAESWMLNEAISQSIGEDVNINFSSLAPAQLDGFAHLAAAFWTGGPVELLAKAPAHSLLTKEGSRMQDAIGRIGRYGGFLDTEDGIEPETMTTVLRGVASVMSAGYSNYEKAQMLLANGRVVDKQGNQLLSNPTWAHAAAQLFGFSSMDEALQFQFKKEYGKSKKAFNDEVENWYKDYKRVLFREGNIVITDYEATSKILGAMKKRWETDPNGEEAMKLIYSNLKRDTVANPLLMQKIIVEHGKLPVAGTELNNLKILKNEDLDKAIQIQEDIKKAIKTSKEEK